MEIIGADFRFEVPGHRRRNGSVFGGGTMASAECIMSLRALSGVRGQSPWSGGQGAKPPEAESILVIGCPTEPVNLAPFQKCLALQGMNGLTVDLSALRKTRANN